MKRSTFIFCIISFVFFCCNKKDNSPTNSNNIITPTDSIPKLVRANYIDLDKIYRISTFRSAVGHDYSDQFESCRSMKHYFEPKSSVDWSLINIYSPVNGTINTIREESMGTQLQIQSDEQPAYQFIIFHIKTVITFQAGDKISAGQKLGNHIGSQTMSDIAVGVSTTNGWKLISYFQVMPDSLFSLYQNRGIQKRDTMIISKEMRDADTLKCNGDAFFSEGTLLNWIVLK